MNDGWDSGAWLARFRSASKRRDGPELRSLRADVFQDTVAVVRARGYDLAGRWIDLDRGGHYDELHAGTTFHHDTDDLELTAEARRRGRPRVEVRDADCLEVARELGSEGEPAAVLNMASRRNPGGGALDGAGAQEENLFRRSNLLHSLYQFVHYGPEYGVDPSPHGHGYPIPRESGGIYSRPATVFRSSEGLGYALLAEPYRAAFVTVPAIPSPAVRVVDGELRLTEEMAEASRRKVRAILRIGAHHAHRDLVLSAFGCGAFRNPPGHMAEIFRETLEEPEFEGAFRRIVFAIIDDHNAGRRHNPQGNLEPFAAAFSDW